MESTHIGERSAKRNCSRGTVLEDSIHGTQTAFLQIPPIHDMPTEILIFLLYIKTGTKVEQVDMLSQIHDKLGPYSLIQTCSRWRRIALDFPELWTTIVLNNDQFSDQSVMPGRVAPVTEDVALQAFKRRLVLTRRMTLYLKINFVSLNVYTSTALLTAVFEVLQRCYAFRMHVDQGSIPIDPFLILDKCPRFPTLQRIHLTFVGAGSHSSHFQDLFSDAPRLDSISWKQDLMDRADTIAQTNRLSGLLLPWTQLTAVKLHLRDCDLSVLLRLCPNLISLCYWSYNERDRWLDPSPFKLQFFGILRGEKSWQDSRPALEAFFENARLPGLRDFGNWDPEDYSFSWSPYAAPFPPVDETLSSSLAVFLQNSPQNLQEIILSSFRFNIDFLTLIESLSFTPNLISLEIQIRGLDLDADYEGNICQRFSSLFTVRSSDEVVGKPFLPKLRYFSLMFSSKIDADRVLYLGDDPHATVNMVKSRRDARVEESGMGPLKKFEMSWRGKLFYSGYLGRKAWLDEIEDIRALAVEGQFLRSIL
jgi:hypothetical protein